MRLSLCGIIGVGACMSALGQPEWQKAYGAWGSDRGYGISATPDSGFVIVGSTGSFGVGGGDGYVLRLDGMGELMWSTTIGGPSVDELTAVKVLSDGSIVAVGSSNSAGSGGYDGLFVHLDPQGLLISEKYLGGDDWDFLYDIEVLDDGYVVVGATYEPALGSECWILRLDAGGDTTWTRTFGGSGADELRGVTVASDGGFVVAGTIATGSRGLDAVLTKLDPLGSQTWSTMLGTDSLDEGFDVAEVITGDYVIAGHSDGFGPHRVMYLAAVDQQGTPTWTNQVSGGNGEWACRSIKELGNGELLLAGATSSYGAGGRDLYLAHTDPYGNWISGPTFGTPGDEDAFGFEIGKDGGYVIAGVTDGAGSGTTAVYVVRTNGDVLTSPIEEVFDDLAVDNGPSSQICSVYPVPSTSLGAVHVTLSRSVVAQGLPMLFDINGRSVDPRMTWHGSKELTLTGLDPGTYFLRVITEGGLAVARLVVQ